MDGGRRSDFPPDEKADQSDRLNLEESRAARTRDLTVQIKLRHAARSTVPARIDLPRHSLKRRSMSSTLQIGPEGMRSAGQSEDVCVFW